MAKTKNKRELAQSDAALKKNAKNRRRRERVKARRSAVEAPVRQSGQTGVSSRAAQRVQAERNAVVKRYRYNDGLLALLHQTMEPTTCRLVRMPVSSFSTCMGTALAKTVDTFTIPWTSVPTGSAFFPVYPRGSGNSLVVGKPEWQPLVVLRDPIVESIVRTMAEGALNPGDATCVYNLDLAFNGLDGYGVGIYDFAVVAEGLNANLPIAGLSLNAASPIGYQIYGPNTPSGVNENQRVIWIDAAENASATINLTFTAAGPVLMNNEIVAQLVLHTGKDDTAPIDSKPFTVNAGVWTLPAPLTTLVSGYFSVNIYSNNAANGARITFSRTEGANTLQTQVCAGYRHVVADSLVNKEKILDQVRVNGVSALCQNVVTGFTKGGTVYAMQTTGLQPWYTMFGSTDTIGNTNLNQRYVGKWADGLYTFVKPQGDSPMSLRPAWDRGNMANTSQYASPLPMFRPFADQGYVCILLVPATVNNVSGATVYPTSTATVTICRALEYTTRDQFFDVDSPTLLPAQFNDYANEIGRVPQFYENPFHLSDVSRFIGKALMHASYFMPPGLNVAAKLGAGAFGIVGSWMEQKREGREHDARMKRMVDSLD